MTTATASRQRLDRSVWIALCAVAASMGSPSVGSSAEIYKSVDSKGQVTYSDRPSPDAERIYLRTEPTISDADRARIAAEQEARARVEEERTRRADAANQEQARRTEAEQARREQCRRARDRYLMFSESGRLYRRDEQGNRVYYTSAEIDAERAAAQKKMKELCDADAAR